jgi:hypothetical protein
VSLLGLPGAVLVLFPERNLYKKVWLQGRHKDREPTGKMGLLQL